MRERNFPVWGVILIILVLISLCGLLVLGFFFLFGFSFFSPAAFSVGPTFVSPGALAADVVYEATSANADAGSIVVLDEAPGGDYHAVLIGYITDDEPHSRLVLTRRAGEEYLVENGRSGRSSSNDDFRAATRFVDGGRETYVAVTGEISNADVAQIEIMWDDGNVTVDTPPFDRFHTFFWFGAAPGTEAQPHTVRALDASGAVISAVALGP